MQVLLPCMVRVASVTCPDALRWLSAILFYQMRSRVSPSSALGHVCPLPPPHCFLNRHVMHAGFPDLPRAAPLTFTLTMYACLSRAPEERPTFEQILTLFNDLGEELSSGKYINSLGQPEVCCCAALSLLHVSQTWLLSGISLESRTILCLITAPLFFVAV